MKPRKRRRPAILALLFFSGCLVGFFCGQTDGAPCFFSLVLEADRPVETQLFYDTGRKFNEAESQQSVVYRQDQAVTLSFLLPVSQGIRQLRFDPARSAAAICIGDALFACEGKESVAIPAEKMTPLQGIRSLKREGGRLCFETVGQDPILLIDQAQNESVNWVRPLLHSLGGGGLALALSFILFWLYKQASSGEENWPGR